VGVPAVGRNHAELGNIIGMFVNTLAMRNFPLREYLFEEFLDEVRENTLKAYENQDYPLEELITKLNIPKEINRNPLFDTLFVSEDTGVPQLKIDGLTFTYDESENKISHLDLVLYINEKDNDKIKLVLEYSTALFSKSTAERMLEYYVEILTQVVGDREIQLKDIEISHALLIPTANNHVEAQVDFGF
jgi:non-ribosomal peptide synthetase component F